MADGTSEEEFRCLRTLEVQVCRVFPSESNAAMDLDVLRGCFQVRLRAVRLREAANPREVLVGLVRAASGVVGGRPRRFDGQQHVRALVLDRLEGSDRAAELNT